MWVRQQAMLKPDNYTESCMINEADRWRGRNVWYLGRSVRYALKEVTTAESSAERTEVSRGHSSQTEQVPFEAKDRISRSLEYRVRTEVFSLSISAGIGRLVPQFSLKEH